MSNRRAQKLSATQPGLFGPPDQPDLFPTAPRSDVYVPKQPHVRNSLIKLLADLRALGSWSDADGWEVRALRDQRGPYLVGLISDADEAAEWRRQLEAEKARIGAATPA